MQLTTLFTTALVALTSVVDAAPAAAAAAAPKNTANVINNCDFRVFLRSYPYDGSTPGPFTILQPGSSYTETYLDGGSTVKLSNKRTLASPLFFAYTNEAAQVFYSLDTKFGNPFIDYRNKLIPNNPQCQRFNCAPGATGCYSNNNSKVFQCDKPVNLTATLCA